MSKLSFSEHNLAKTCAELADVVYSSATPSNCEDFTSFDDKNRGMVSYESRWRPVAVFRGTNQSANWPQNLDNALVGHGSGLGGATVHRGFREALENVRPMDMIGVIRSRCPQAREWVVTGHSLGGAMAALFILQALEMGAEHVTYVSFGAPQPGNYALKKIFCQWESRGKLKMLRLVNCFDPVPKLLDCVGGFCHPCEKALLDMVPLQILKCMGQVMEAVAKKSASGMLEDAPGMADHSMNRYIENLMTPVLGAGRSLANVLANAEALAVNDGVVLPEGIKALLRLSAGMGQARRCELLGSITYAGLSCAEAPLTDKLMEALGFDVDVASTSVRVLKRTLLEVGKTGVSLEHKVSSVASTVAAEATAWMLAKYACRALETARSTVVCMVSSFMMKSYSHVKAWINGAITGHQCLRDIFGDGIETVTSVGGAVLGGWAASCLGVAGPLGWVVGAALVLVGGFGGSFCGKKMKEWYYQFFDESPQEGIRMAYRQLGLTLRASDKDVRAAYYRLSRMHHPDKGGSQEKFCQINVAYQTVMASRGHNKPPSDADWGQMFPEKAKAIEDKWDLQRELDVDDDSVVLEDFQQLSPYMQYRKQLWLGSCARSMSVHSRKLDKEVEKMRVRQAYSCLGLHEGCTKEAAQRAFKKRWLLYHPDKASTSMLASTSAFQALNEAYAKVTQHLNGELHKVYEPESDPEEPDSDSGDERSEDVEGARQPSDGPLRSSESRASCRNRQEEIYISNLHTTRVLVNRIRQSQLLLHALTWDMPDLSRGI